MQYTFNSNGSFRLECAGKPDDGFDGKYFIMGNHTLVLNSKDATPPDVYMPKIALSKSKLRIDPPFYRDAQTYTCTRFDA